jgi:hypothetical protein
LQGLANTLQKISEIFERIDSKSVQVGDGMSRFSKGIKKLHNGFAGARALFAPKPFDMIGKVRQKQTNDLIYVSFDGVVRRARGAHRFSQASALYERLRMCHVFFSSFASLFVLVSSKCQDKCPKLEQRTLIGIIWIGVRKIVLKKQVILALKRSSMASSSLEAAGEAVAAAEERESTVSDETSPIFSLTPTVA